MSKRIKTAPSQGRDYMKMLKDYFGFHLAGASVDNEGGQVQAQVIYEDYKHIDTVRRELAQMMPEVEFTKLRRDFSCPAETWAANQMMHEWDGDQQPVLYVQRGDTLVRSELRDIIRAELRQLELDENDDIPYESRHMQMLDDDRLRANSWD